MLKRTLVIAICLVAVLVGSILSRTLLSRTGEKEIASQAQACDELLEAYQALGKFNGSVLVAKNGEIILRKGFGVRNDALGSTHDAESIFRIYSITKPFTSTVVLRLVEQKKLSLQDPVSKFYPDFPNGDAITIEHLLTHTSGLYEFTRETGFENTESSLLELLANRAADFPPGEGWSYCNSGYCLLGHIITKASGKPFEDTVTNQIFEPLGMADSGFRFNTLEDPRKAVGYQTFSDLQRIEGVMADENGPFAAGAIYSTVDDLWRFQQALNDGELLSKKLQAKAWTGCPQNPGYGYGWQLSSRWFMRQVTSHSGGATGFRSNLSHVKRSNDCVILLNNHENANVEFLTDCIYEILDGRTVELPIETVKLSQEELQAYVGFYEPADKHGVIHAYILDGRLAIDFLGRAQGTLIADGDDRFFQIESDVEINFQRSANGECVGLIAKQDRMTLEARKYEGAWGIPDSTAQVLNEMLVATPPNTSQWHESAFKLAHLHAYQEDKDRYVELCRQILDEHGDTDSPQIAERTVKVCLLPGSDVFIQEAGKLIDQAYAIRESAGTFDWGGQVHWRDYLAVAKGMADYRRGDSESAINTLLAAKEFSRHDLHSACVRDLLLAMAYKTAGDSGSAIERMDAAKEVIVGLPANYANSSWNDRILVDLLQNEAEDVLSGRASQ